MAYKIDFQRSFKLVDNGNSTQNLHSLCFQNGLLFSEIDCGNVEDILIKNKKLQNDWNELKKWLEEERQELYKQFDNDVNYMHYESQHSLGSCETLEEVLEKMQELEGNNE